MIDVVFFASVRESLGTGKIGLPADEIRTVQDVVRQLASRGDAWQRALTAENLLVAVNQTMAGVNHPVADGDEVAFFPPVTGG